MTKITTEIPIAGKNTTHKHDTYFTHRGVLADRHAL